MENYTARTVGESSREKLLQIMALDGINAVPVPLNSLLYVIMTSSKAFISGVAVKVRSGIRN